MDGNCWPGVEKQISKGFTGSNPVPITNLNKNKMDNFFFFGSLIIIISIFLDLKWYDYEKWLNNKKI